MAQPGYLLLEDGRVFAGQVVGAPGVALGEVVFNTSMTGYQEVLTDPSYAGQLVTMTYPLIGNYGVTAADEESRRPQVAGFIVRELPPLYSNWRAESSLESYLERNGITALTEADTRALTRHIRSAGAMRGAIAPASEPVDEVRHRVDAHPRMEGLDLTGVVETHEPYDVPAEGVQRFHVVAYDFGVKSMSLRLLAERGCRHRRTRYRRDHRSRARVCWTRDGRTPRQSRRSRSRSVRATPQRGLVSSRYLAFMTDE